LLCASVLIQFQVFSRCAFHLGSTAHTIARFSELGCAVLDTDPPAEPLGRHNPYGLSNSQRLGDNLPGTSLNPARHRRAFRQPARSSALLARRRGHAVGRAHQQLHQHTQPTLSRWTGRARVPRRLYEPGRSARTHAPRAATSQTRPFKLRFFSTAGPFSAGGAGGSRPEGCRTDLHLGAQQTLPQGGIGRTLALPDLKFGARQGWHNSRVSRGTWTGPASPGTSTGRTTTSAPVPDLWRFLVKRGLRGCHPRTGQGLPVQIRSLQRRPPWGRVCCGRGGCWPGLSLAWLIQSKGRGCRPGRSGRRGARGGAGHSEGGECLGGVEAEGDAVRTRDLTGVGRLTRALERMSSPDGSFDLRAGVTARITAEIGGAAGRLRTAQSEPRGSRASIPASGSVLVSPRTRTLSGPLW
jgi:hypothetical protein